MKADRRVMLLAAALVAVIGVVLGVVLIGNGSGGGSASTDTTSTTTTSTGTTTGGTTTGTTTATTPNGPAAIAALFAGIPQHGDTIGRPGAPAAMLVFEDPQCPYCAEWNIDTLPTVLAQYVRPGKLKIVYRGIEIIGPNSGVGLRAITAAGIQDKLWNMNEAVFANQGKENSGWITAGLIVALADDLKLDRARLLKDANSAATTKALNVFQADATRYGVGGTPTFEILRPPALPRQLRASSLEPAGFIAALAAALQ